MFTKEDLKLGMVLENERGDLDLIIVNQYDLSALSLYCNGEITTNSHYGWFNNLTNDLKICGPYTGGDIVKVYKDYTLKEIVWERTKEILDEAEKAYLSAVIKPFRNRVKHIYKKHSYMYAYISIILDNDSIQLPYFKIKNMYKGMQFDIEYTLKELGL